MTNEMTLPLGGQTKNRKQWDPPRWMYPIIYNKWKIMICLLLAVFLVGMFSVAFAEEPVELAFGMTDMIEGIFKFDGVESWLQINTNFELEAFFDYGDYEQNGGFATNNGTGTVATFINDIYTTFQVIGFTLLNIYWAIGFFDMLIQSNNQVIPAQMVKKFAILLIGWAVIANSKEIVITLLDWSNRLTDQIQFRSSGNFDKAIVSLADSINNATKGQGLVSALFINLGFLIRLLIPWIGAMIANIGVKIFAVARYVEVCVIACISPMMFSDFSNATGGFTHTNCYRAVKSVAALMFQGMIIVLGIRLCALIASLMVGDSLTTSTFLDVTIGLLAVQLARVGIAAKSQQIARQLVGLA